MLRVDSLPSEPPGKQSNPRRGLIRRALVTLHPLVSPPPTLHLLPSSPAPPVSSLGLCVVVPLPGLQILPDTRTALYLAVLRFLLTETIPDHSISNRHFLTSLVLLNSLPYGIFLPSTNPVCHHTYLTSFLLHLSPPLTGKLHMGKCICLFSSLL